MKNSTTERIREVMGDLSQEKFAKSIKSSQSVVSKILSGDQPSLNVLIEIAKEYKVSIDWLLGLSPCKYLSGCSVFEEDTATTYADVISILVRLMKHNSVSCTRISTEPSAKYDPYGLTADLNREDLVRINDHFIGDLLTVANTILSTSPETINTWLSKVTQDYGIAIKIWDDLLEKNYCWGIKQKTSLEVLQSISSNSNVSDGSPQ